MLLLGVVQAQASGGVAGAGSYDLLATEILSSTQASVTFSSLGDYAADYQHLQIRWVGGNTNVSTDIDNVKITFNGDTGSNYARHRLLGTGSSVLSLASSSGNYAYGGIVTRGSSVAHAANVIDLLDPFETSKYLTIRTLFGATNSSQNMVGINSGLWMNTASLTSFSMQAESVDSFRAGSRFSLYGLRSA